MGVGRGVQEESGAWLPRCVPCALCTLEWTMFRGVSSTFRFPFSFGDGTTRVAHMFRCYLGRVLLRLCCMHGRQRTSTPVMRGR